MFIESLEKFPEELHGDFIEHEMDGKKGFIHKTDEPLINSLKNAKAEREQLRSKYSEAETKLAELDSEREKAIEKARQEAMEEALNSKDMEEYKRLLAEQADDKAKREYERGQQEAAKKFKVEAAQAKANAELTEIVAGLKPISDDAAILMKSHLRGLQKVTEEGDIIYLGEDGSALSVDSKGFLNELVEKGRFKEFRKGDVHASGGGQANGSGSGSAGQSKKFNEYSAAELSQIRQSNPQQYEVLKREFYGN